MPDNPVTPAEVAATIPDSTGSICSKLSALFSLANLMSEWYSWAFNADGTPSDDFITTITDGFLFDTSKKGWFVRTNPTTGVLELVEFIPLDHLEITDATAGDKMVFNGTEWVPSSQYPAGGSTFYGIASSPATVVPSANAGGVLYAAHGLSSRPTKFACILVCNDAGGDLGYAQYDRVDAYSLMALDSNGPENTIGATISADAGAVYASFRNCTGGASFYRLMRGDTAVIDSIDPAKWDVYFFAEN